MKQTFKDLDDKGVKIPEFQKALTVLGSLDSSWDTFALTLESVPEMMLTLSYLTGRLLEEAEKRAKNASMRGSLILAEAMASKERLDLNNPNEVARLHELLLDDSEDEDESAAGSSNRAPSYGVPDEDCDTDTSECLEEREDSETERSDTDISEEDEEREEDEHLYHCYRKKGKKIIESFEKKNTLQQPQES
ncbi:hypothetical protein lerEdw1_000234 [Lerista edwardsae]|nr:hypothetical protein lerEdw1_000234 [Lerista edwardsae]